jgi:hypothetical protein
MMSSLGDGDYIPYTGGGHTAQRQGAILLTELIGGFAEPASGMPIRRH